MTFDDLVSRTVNKSSSLKEQTPLRVNEQGQKLIKEYRDLILKIQNTLLPVLQPYVTDPTTVGKEAAVHIISSINSNKQGTANFDVMSRLDTITNGGKTQIDPSTFTFNAGDPILQYLSQ